MPIAPKQSLSEIAARGTELLEHVIAIDSHSDERSESIPSTPGQARLSKSLAEFFSGLGYASTVDDNANLMVEIPAKVEGAPKLAFMVHIDTARGTEAVPKLETLPAWTGERIPFPRNEHLQVSVENYPETEVYRGEDLLFGPGEAPIGLDDKLGMSEMMLMAELLAQNPQLPHGELVLVCRPDEEIGRMEAVEGLAAALEQRGVTRGYTVDGLAPFEVNTENFNAARASVNIQGQPLKLAPATRARALELSIRGAKSHGATAKSEGYLNATVVCARALASLPDSVVLVDYNSDHSAEVDAKLRFVLRADDEPGLDAAQTELLSALDAQLAPHAWKGARVELGESNSADPAAEYGDELPRLFAHIRGFLAKSEHSPSPLLSEDSEHDQGYSNPYFVSHEGRAATLDYRLRDFTDAGLTGRKRHIEALCANQAGLSLELADQYVNMGPSLAPFPELVSWAETAASAMGREILRRPIRGGTGVDPFLARGIPIANVGTGYFAPESEKEFTSRQNLAAHALWLVNLVQVVAEASA